MKITEELKVNDVHWSIHRQNFESSCKHRSYSEQISAMTEVASIVTLTSNITA